MGEDADKPDWWCKARALEKEGRLEAAEDVIRDGIPHLHFAYATADFYQERMLRLMEAGDEAGALEAFRKSRGFIYFYASLATSGGEGAALSVERDAFLRGLIAAYGSDPGE
jgi:hypothetical protein